MTLKFDSVTWPVLSLVGNIEISDRTSIFDMGAPQVRNANWEVN